MKKKLLTITLSSALLLSNTSLILAESKVNKDETIYVSLDEDGSVKQADASIHLSSDKAIKEIEDRSNLDHIQNIKSDLEAENTNGKIKWNTDEKEIYYTGKVTKQTPVTFDIVYKLNGKTIKLEDALGKDGKFEMQIKAQNNHRKNITVNGKQQNLFVPYAVLGLVPLNKENYENVKADHAKVLSDGNKEMIAFVTLPGMKQNFDIKDIDETIKIEADVHKLSMDPIYLTAVPLEIDLEDDSIDLSSLDDLKAELLDGLSELKDGTKALYEGNETLNDGVHKLEEGTMSAKEGAQQLEAGASALNNALNQAQTGSQSLASGAQQVAQGNQQLANKFNEVMYGINKNGTNLASDALAAKVNQFNSGIKQLKGGAQNLSSGANELHKGSQQLNAGILELVETIETNKIKINDTMAQLGTQLEGKSGQISELVAHNQEMSYMIKMLSTDLDELNAIEEEDRNQVINLAIAVNALPEEQGQKAIKDTMIKLLKGNITLSNQLLGLFNEINTQYQVAQEKVKILNSEELEENLAMLVKGSSDLETGLSQLSNGSKELLDGITILESETNKLSAKLDDEKIKSALKDAPKLQKEITKLAEGSQAVAVGNEGLNAGISEIAGKSPELQAGTSALNSGLNELNSGASALSEGSDQLLDGSKTLYEAVEEIDVDEHKFDDLLEHKDELEALMKDNDSFTGKTDTMEGKVKFICKTNKQEKEDEVVEQVEEDKAEKGFFNWLKNLFK